MASRANCATLVVFMEIFYCVGASHDAGGFHGIANISLENPSLLTITGHKITCILASNTDIPVTFTWHWKSPAPAKAPGHFFDWNYLKEVGFDGRQNYKSRLIWKSGASFADKKSVTGAIIYGKGSHGDDATTCPDVTLNIMSSHDAGGFRGIANISLENSSLLTITGNTITCILASDKDIPVTFTWHWKSPAPAKAPEHLFDWTYDTKVGFDGRPNYESRLIWKSGASFADKKLVRGAIIYGKGSHGDDATTCPDVTLNIMWNPGMASVLQNPTSGDILRDSRLIMTCSGDNGNPSGSVTWKINGTEMTDDMYKTDLITINAAQSEHDGDWTCFFINSLGSGFESEIQHVEVKWQPGPCSLILNPDDDYIILGSELILACTCADKGKPTGEINWSLNGNKNYGSMYQTDVITIDSVESQHEGEWECYYMNAIGIGTPSMKSIDIKWPPGRSLILVDTQFPKLHDSFTLTCTGDQGNPKGRVVWLLDSLVFTTTTDVTLNISSAAQEHNGDWSCMFFNHLDDGGISDSLRVQVLCLPSLNVEYVSYTFNESYVHFNLRLNDESAADTVNVQVCSTPNDEPLCSTASSKLENKELISDVELPESSDHTLYNVSFIFSHGSRIVSRHGIALRGNEKQSSTSTIFAAVFGALWIITAGIAAVVIVLYHRRLKEKDVNPPKEKEAEVHYVNVGAETGADTVTYKTSATDYEDVARDAAPISAHSTENTTYMDLDQNDVQQTRNRPAELTVYQSLH